MNYMWFDFGAGSWEVNTDVTSDLLSQ